MTTDDRTPWRGVIPAITTPFTPEGGIDTRFLADHASGLIEEGCAGIVVCGSLGEGATLTFDEKLTVLATCHRSVGSKSFVATAVSSLSTADAVRYARAAEFAGAHGLMVLPPYAYSTDWREMRSHVSAVIGATDLPCLLYNNPIAYKTDFLVDQVLDLADRHSNLVAVKESSADIRRVTSLRAEAGDRLVISIGVDDLIVEAIAAGASGWVAGLVNALPAESVKLFELATTGAMAEAQELYRWFLPLLRLDTAPKFVQLIKLVQQCCGLGSARVRPPRLELESTELTEALGLINASLLRRPSLAA